MAEMGLLRATLTTWLLVGEGIIISRATSQTQGQQRTVIRHAVMVISGDFNTLFVSNSNLYYPNY